VPTNVGRSPTDVLGDIGVAAHDLQERHARAFGDVIKPMLDSEGIHIEVWADLGPDDRAQIDEIFANQIFPVLMPLEHMGAHAHHMPATDSLWIASLAVLVHTLAMLVVTGIVALVVYEWVGLDFLRRGWVNLDLVWTAALIGIGLWLLVS
jgi:polyphosphate kinase